jgi:hypothetical protein
MKRESLITNTEKLLFDILQEQIKQNESLVLIRESLLNKNEESFNKKCSGNCSCKSNDGFNLKNLDVTCDINSGICSVNEKPNEKTNDKLSKPNKKTNAKKKG